MGAPNVALPKNPEHVAVVLVAALGSRTVELSATQSSIIPGPMASRLAKMVLILFRLNHHEEMYSVTWE